MEIRKIAIEELHPAPYNPRVTLAPGDPRHDRLARSLEEFELVQPPVWNQRTRHIVGGHQRVEILRRQGAIELECVVVDLPLEREQALNVALNNAHVGGDWEPEKLVDLLEELQALPDFDMSLTGFDEQQLRDLVLAPAELPQFDASAEEPNERSAGGVTVVLEIPEACWPRVQARLDALAADEPDVDMHVRVGAAD